MLYAQGMTMKRIGFIVLLSALAAPVTAQPGTVLSHQKISDTEGGFTGILELNDFFGYSVASLGDLDGDGVGDLAVGAFNDDDGDPCTADSCDPGSGCENIFPACGPADGCCGPGCDSGNDDDCPSCGAKNDSCTVDEG